jgi:hypothetical protein
VAALVRAAADGQRQIARYLGNRGSYLAARDLFQLIAGAAGIVMPAGPEHRETLTACPDLAV